jgi:ribosome-associated heat shock protein Hsp15
VDEGLRIDKWLWAIRIFKTRSLASEACKAGKVKVGGQAVKASREVRMNDTFQIGVGPITRVIRVKELLKNRMSAKLAALAFEDLTPEEEYEKLRLIKDIQQGIRPHGLGRPTKKDRRDLDKFAP